MLIEFIYRRRRTGQYENALVKHRFVEEFDKNNQRNKWVAMIILLHSRKLFYVTVVYT